MSAGIQTSLAGLRRLARLAGFTTVELVVTLLIIGIIAAIALPRMSNDPVLLSTQAEQLANDIRYVQSLAMTQGQRYLIAFPSNTTYEFRNSAGTVVPHPVDGSMSVNLAVRVASITMVLQALTPAGNALGFDGKGVPYSVTAPNTFNGPLTAQATITLTLNAATPRTVTVTQETGRVLVP